jgi:putative FmdB family regulatory protein
MPTYEYACRVCGHRFETVQSMKDDALTVCPECGGELRKVLHAAGIVFKGSGFYATDNRPKPKEETAKKEEPAKDAKGTKETKESTRESTSGSKGPDAKKATTDATPSTTASTSKETTKKPTRKKEESGP